MGVFDWLKFDDKEEDEIKLFSGSKDKAKQKSAPKPVESKSKKQPAKAAKIEIKSKAKQIEEEDENPYPIKCTAIVEMLGAPKEYIEKTIKEYIEVMKKTKALKIKNVKISPTEPKEKMFALFAEIEMDVKTPEDLVGFCFDYMPSSVDVFEPAELSFKANELSNFFNDLQDKLHRLDMMVKNLRAENTILEKNARQLLRNNILLTLKDKSKDLKMLAKNNGIPPEQLEPFLDEMVKEHWIKKVGEEYCLVKPL